MASDLVLRGHSWIVDLLVTLRTTDGRLLLVSADTHNAVRVWDPLTGDLEAAPADADSVHTELGALGLGELELARASGLAVVPLTPRTPALAVHIGRERVRLTEVGTDRALFTLNQPPDPKGHIGPAIFRAVGVRFGDGTSGFAAARFSGDLELWTPGRWRWRHRTLPVKIDGGLVVLDDGDDGSQLAVGVGRGFEVWNVTTRSRTARVEADSRVTAMASLPLATGPALAWAGPSRPDGIRLYDPYRGRSLGRLTNEHGPSFGQSSGTSQILALAAIPGPGDTIRLASGAQDGTIRISAPIGKADPHAFGGRI
jgi:WD40 repeat protein